MSLISFYNTDIVLMKRYFPNVMLFNFKTGSINMLQQENGHLHACFPFQAIMEDILSKRDQMP